MTSDSDLSTTKSTRALGLHQKIRIVHGANGHAYEFVHPLRHTHLTGRYPEAESQPLGDINGPKEFCNILPDKDKIIQHNDVLIQLIRLIILEVS